EQYARWRDVGKIANVRQDVRDGIHYGHWTVLFAQRRRDWMGVAVLQTRQDSPTGEIHFARRRCGKLSNVSVGTDGDEEVAANRDRLDFRAIRPHRHDMAVVVDGVGRELRRRGLCKKPGGNECET